MQFTLSKQAIYQAVLRYQGIVERRHTIPILSNLLLEASEQELKITATDLEIILKTRVEADIKKTGTITVSYRKLYEIIKELNNNADVNISLEKSFLTIHSASSNCRLSTLPANDYPNLNEEIEVEPIRIDGRDLARMIAATSFAMSNDETRKYLTGTLFELKASYGLKLIATDGHRLSLAEARLQDISSDIQCIVPRKAVIEIRKLAEEIDKQVLIYMGHGFIRLESGAFTLSSKLIDARFPAYNEVIPKIEEDGIVLDRVSLDQVLRRVMIVANEFTHDIQFQFKDDKLNISAHNADQEEADEAIDISYSGPELNIGFNARYLRDVLTVIQGKNIRMQLKDNLSPVLIMDDTRDAEHYVIMPMRI